METCKICKAAFVDLMAISRHIVAKHKISTKEYTIKHLCDGVQPVCPVCGAETRYVRLSFKRYCKEHANLARKESCEKVGKLQAWNKGKTKENNEILKRQADKVTGAKNHFYGKHHSKDTIAKLKRSVLVTESQYYERLLARCRKPDVVMPDKEFVLETPYAEYQSRQHQHLTLRCTKCGQTNKKTLQAFERGSRCCYCFPIQKYSKEEMEVKAFVQAICSSKTIANTRKVIAPLELDVYVPDKKFAIEYNGLYWHSERSKSKYYHRDKTRACQAVGVRLFHVFSDEWRDKQPILKSMIAYRLGVLTSRVSARNCIIRQLTSAEARRFFNETHISGWTRSKVVFGLIDKDGKIVSALGLRVPRQKKKYPNALEISRFSNKLNTIVNGSFSKLLEQAKAYASQARVNSIVTYADLRFGDGSVYLRNGFKEGGETAVDYWYTDNEERYNRFTFRAKDGKSEKQIAQELMVDRVYGCGSKLYVMSIL